MVCLRNTSVITLHKGDNEDDSDNDDNDDDDNKNNNNNNNNNNMQFNRRYIWRSLHFDSVQIIIAHILVTCNGVLNLP
jgi:hypothetical protein